MKIFDCLIFLDCRQNEEGKIKFKYAVWFENPKKETDNLVLVEYGYGGKSIAEFICESSYTVKYDTFFNNDNRKIEPLSYLMNNQDKVVKISYKVDLK